MSKEKYPSIFSHQMEANVFIILQIIFGTRTVLKIGFTFSWGIFSQITSLDHSQMCKKISWIIINNYSPK